MAKTSTGSMGSFDVEAGRAALSWFIIGVVLLLAMAPLWHFMPTKRQKHQARLREAAAIAGLFVEFRDLPLAPARLARLATADRQVLYYGRRLKPSRREVRPSLAWYREAGDWTCLSARVMPPDIASELPETVLALRVNEASCGVYWREEGDENTVRDIASLLQAWQAQLEGVRTPVP